MISIASDHRGYKLKEEIKLFLDEKGIEYKDFGADNEERMDYPEKATAVAKSLQNHEASLGILICGTGLGMSIVANKYKGVRCTVCTDTTMAGYARSHNNSNILALGAELTTIPAAIDIVNTWLGTSFEGERHIRRVELISEIEDINFK